MQVDLRDLAYARAGDKGDTSNVIVATYVDEDYDWLKRHLTSAVVEGQFGSVVAGPITRYELPGTRMLNFVMENALQGGVSRSISLDMHGKSRASLMLSIQMECDPSDAPPSGRSVPT